MSLFKSTYNIEIKISELNLIVFSQTLRTAGSSSLDLTSCQSNNEVSDEAILCLSRPVGDHGTPT